MVKPARPPPRSGARWSSILPVTARRSACAPRHRAPPLSPEISVVGGGPAGASAAIAARLQGRSATVYEKSTFPRHKVCGEFLSPEIAPLLEQLGVWPDFADAQPARIRRLTLRFRKREKRCNLPEPAYGLSRYRFDHLLLEAARKLGARISEEPASEGTVIAHGRKSALPRGRRLFGFKAHYEGPANDAVELYFFNKCYVGISPVENGVTNVCGLGPEDLFLTRHFNMDDVVDSFEPLRDRLRPLRRLLEWLKVGPLVFEHRLHATAGQYAAGDALSFVDPFTGSGILSAVLTGRLAGIAAARGITTADYAAQCRRSLERPFQVSSVFRKALALGWAEPLATVVPGRLLVRLTRPHPSL